MVVKFRTEEACPVPKNELNTCVEVILELGLSLEARVTGMRTDVTVPRIVVMAHVTDGELAEGPELLADVDHE